MFHLKRKISQVFGGFNNNRHDVLIRNKLLELVDEYNPYKLLQILENLSYQDKKQEKVNELYSYIYNNVEQIANHTDETLHGSGYIEKGVDLMISRRLKMRGMGWTKTGANSMLKLKVLEYNKEEKEYWDKRKNLELVV
jgi:hypothetical protein